MEGVDTDPYHSIKFYIEGLFLGWVLGWEGFFYFHNYMLCLFFIILDYFINKLARVLVP